MGFFNFSFWRFLCFFLKPVKQHNELSFIETAKNPIDIRLVFNPYFVKSVRARNMLHKFFRNSVHLLYHLQYVLDFSFDLFVLFLVEIRKVRFVEYYLPRHTKKLS